MIIHLWVKSIFHSCNSREKEFCIIQSSIIFQVVLQNTTCVKKIQAISKLA